MVLWNNWLREGSSKAIKRMFWQAVSSFIASWPQCCVDRLGPPGNGGHREILQEFPFMPQRQHAFAQEWMEFTARLIRLADSRDLRLSTGGDERQIKFDRGTRSPTLQPTFSLLSANNPMVSTPLRSGSTSGVNISFDVSMRTCFRSVGSNCQSFTKILQPISDPGVWEDIGGLRMYEPTGKSPCSSWNTPSSTRNSSPPPWRWAEKRLFGA